MFELPMNPKSRHLVGHLLNSIRSEKRDEDWYIRPGTVLRCDGESSDELNGCVSFVSIPGLHSFPYKVEARKEEEEVCQERRLRDAFGSIGTHADLGDGWSQRRAYPVLWVRQTWVLLAGTCKSRP
jgi:hypothetical protein